MASWKNREIFIDHKRNVDSEMIECGITTDDMVEILEKGVCPVKRKKGIIEKWKREGNKVIIVAIEDCTGYWLVRHVSRTTATKKILRILRGE